MAGAIYADCDCIIAGDFNVDLDTSDNIACQVNSLITEHNLVRCDDLFPRAKIATYVNNSLNQQSRIDYMLVSSSLDVRDYDVIDPDVNFSDHLPLICKFVSHSTSSMRVTSAGPNCDRERVAPVQLRWDHADLLSYYNYTRIDLEQILSRVNDITSLFNDNNIALIDCVTNIDKMHDDIITALSTGAKLCVPHHRKSFYKCWWDQEMDVLKAESIETDKVWKASDRPRRGPFLINANQAAYNIARR